MFKVSILLLIIYIGHSTWDYCKNNLSKPKTKDLVNIQTEKYRNIIQELTKPVPVVTQLSLVPQPTPPPPPLPPVYVEPTTTLSPLLSTDLSIEQQLELQMDLEQLVNDIN